MQEETQQEEKQYEESLQVLQRQINRIGSSAPKPIKIPFKYSQEQRIVTTRPGHRHFKAPTALTKILRGFSLPLDIPKETIRGIATVLGKWVARKKDYALELKSNFNGSTRIRVQGYDPEDCAKVIEAFLKAGQRHARPTARRGKKRRKKPRKKKT